MITYDTEGETGRYWYHFDALGSVIALSQYNSTDTGAIESQEDTLYSPLVKQRFTAPARMVIGIRRGNPNSIMVIPTCSPAAARMAKLAYITTVQGCMHRTWAVSSNPIPSATPTP